ncbi:hypothetical protein [Streptomyces sp. bgisy082]
MVADAEAVRARAWWSAEWLTETPGERLPYGLPRVIVSAVGHLVRTGM